MTGPELQDFIQGVFAGFLADPQNNNLGPGRAEKAWQDFVIGYSSGSDDLYGFWRVHIHSSHWTPAEAFLAATEQKAFDSGAAALAPSGPDVPPTDAELTVISWALSHTEQTKADNTLETRLPSERWARSRIYGQSCNRALHRTLVAALAARGYSAVAPALLPAHSEITSAKQGRSSNWSERHVAYTSGLGTFGLCGGLITPLGQAVRLGSVIVRASIPATPRPYTGPFDYCLYFSDAGCTACAERCPVDSMRSTGRDKTVCAQHLEITTAEFVQNEFGFKGYGCGLCQTGVPCESSIPAPLG